MVYNDVATHGHGMSHPPPKKKQKKNYP